MRKMAILTSGGDCPGMNAAVVAATRCAAQAGIQLMGVRYGFDGLIDENLIPLKEIEIRHLASRGGSFLRTSRSRRFRSPEGIRAALGMLQNHRIDAVIVIGGDGSLHGAKALHEAGVPVMAVPATIDNDISGTDYALGFDTACNHTIRVVHDILDTASSLEGRIFLIETLGLPTGFIAYASAMAVGADFYLVPEIPYDLGAISAHLKTRVQPEKGYAIGIMSEAIGSATEVAKEIEAQTGIRVRPTVIGHAQRGGSPTFFDHTLAEAFARKVIGGLLTGQTFKMAAFTGNTTYLIEAALPLEMKKSIYELPAIFNQ